MVIHTLILSAHGDFTSVQRDIDRRMSAYATYTHVTQYITACVLCRGEEGNSSCTYCYGVGRLITQTNPHGRWETWLPGGRFDGLMTNSDVDGQASRFHFFLNTTTVRNIPERVLSQVRMVIDVTHDRTSLAPIKHFDSTDQLREYLVAHQDLLATLLEVQY